MSQTAKRIDGLADSVPCQVFGPDVQNACSSVAKVCKSVHKVWNSRSGVDASSNGDQRGAIALAVAVNAAFRVDLETLLCAERGNGLQEGAELAPELLLRMLNCIVGSGKEFIVEEVAVDSRRDDSRERRLRRTTRRRQLRKR